MASEGRQGGGGSACSSSSSSRQPSQATHIHMHMHRHAYTSYPAPVAAARLFCTCPPAPTKCPAPIGLGTMCVFNSSLSQTQQGRPIRHCTQQGAPQARRKKTGFSFLALENPCSPPVFCVCLSVSTTVTLRTQTAWPVPSRLQVCVGTSLPIPAQDSRWFSALSVLAP